MASLDIQKPTIVSDDKNKTKKGEDEHLEFDQNNDKYLPTDNNQQPERKSNIQGENSTILIVVTLFRENVNFTKIQA